MTFSVLPLGEVVKWKTYIKRVLIYSSASIISGGMFGLIFTIFIFLISFWIPLTIKTFILIVIVFAYFLHEVGFVKLNIPQNHWQIPESWVNQTPNINMMVWGMILGAGIFTYIPHITFYIVYLYIGLFFEPYLGFIFGMAYGFSRVLPTIILSSIRNSKITNLDGGDKSILKVKKISGPINALALGIMLVFLILH